MMIKKFCNISMLLVGLDIDAKGSLMWEVRIPTEIPHVTSVSNTGIYYLS